MIKQTKLSNGRIATACIIWQPVRLKPAVRYVFPEGDSLANLNIFLARPLFRAGVLASVTVGAAVLS